MNDAMPADQNDENVKKAESMMLLKIKNQQDFVAGIIFAGAGVIALLLAWNYSFGTLRQVGPGFFPIVVAWLLAAFGLIMILRSLASKQSEAISLSLWPLTIIVISSLVFGTLIRPLGLPLSAALLVLLSTLASRSLGWLAAISLAIGIAAFVTLVFIVGLGLQMPLLGSLLR